MLYSSWFPNFNQDQYKNLVIKQGAEYSSMEIYLIKNLTTQL